MSKYIFNPLLLIAALVVLGAIIFVPSPAHALSGYKCILASYLDATSVSSGNGYYGQDNGVGALCIYTGRSSDTCSPYDCSPHTGVLPGQTCNSCGQCIPSSNPSDYCSPTSCSLNSHPSASGSCPTCANNVIQSHICASDSNCETGSTCKKIGDNVNGYCSCGGCSQSSECVNDSDCSGGACVSNSTSSTGKSCQCHPTCPSIDQWPFGSTTFPTCTSDSDCGGTSGSCNQLHETCQCNETCDQNALCSQDADCPGGSCLSGKCSCKEQCTHNLSCRSDEDCGGGSCGGPKVCACGNTQYELQIVKFAKSEKGPDSAKFHFNIFPDPRQITLTVSFYEGAYANEEYVSREGSFNEDEPPILLTTDTAYSITEGDAEPSSFHPDANQRLVCFFGVSNAYNYADFLNYWRDKNRPYTNAAGTGYDAEHEVPGVLYDPKAGAVQNLKVNGAELFYSAPFAGSTTSRPIVTCVFTDIKPTAQSGGSSSGGKNFKELQTGFQQAP